MSRRIEIELDLDDKNYAVKIRRNIEATDRFEREVKQTTRSVEKMERGINGLLPKLRDYAVTLSVVRGGMHMLSQATVGWQKTIITANAEIERMIFLLKGISDGATDVERTMDAMRDTDWVLDFAQKTPFPIQELSNTFVKFRTIGIEPTKASMLSLTDAVAAFGGDDKLLHRASVALQQMAGKGVISMEELRQQLGEAVPTAIKKMAQALNMPIANLTKQVSLGAVEATESIRRLMMQFSLDYGGAGERLMDSWIGLIQRLKTRWTLFMKDIGDGGYFPEMKRQLAELVTFLGTKEAAEMGAAIGHALGDLVVVLRSVVDWFARWGGVIWDVIRALAAFKVIRVVANLAQGATNWFAGLSAAIIGTAAPAKGFRINLRGMVRQMGLARTASLALGRAMGLMGGPIGVAITLLGSALFAVSEFNRRANEVQETINDIIETQGKTATREDIEAIENQYSDNLEKRARDIRLLLENFELNLFGNTIIKKRHLERTLSEIERLIQARNLGLKEILKRERDEGANMMRTELRGRVDDMSRAYKRESANLYDEFNNGNMEQEEFIEGRLDILRRRRDEELALIQDMIFVQSDALNKAKMDGNSEAAADTAGRLEFLQKAFEDTGIKYQEMLNALSQTFPKMIEDEDAKGLDKFKRLIVSISGRIEQLRAQGNRPGSEGFVEKLSTRLSGGYYGEDVTNEDAQRAIDLARELEAVLSRNDAAESIKSMKNEIRELRSEMGIAYEQGQSFSRMLESGEFGNPDLLGEEMIQRLHRNFEELQGLKMEKDWTEELAAADDEANASLRSLSEEIRTTREEMGLAFQQAENFRDVLARGDFGDPTLLGTEKIRQLRERFNELQGLTLEKQWREELAVVEEFVDEIVAETKDANEALDEFFMTQTQRRQKKLADEKRMWQQRLNDERLSIAQRRTLNDKYYAWLERRTMQAVYESGGALGRMVLDWSDVSENLKTAGSSWMNSWADNMASLVTTGKASFRDLGDTIVHEMNRMAIKLMTSKMIMWVIGNMGFNMSGVEGVHMGSQQDRQLASDNYDSPFTYNAKGGVMTPSGSMPLKKYARGGIAKEPQVAVFGEGSYNEAYVPLPDGRRIPVTLQEDNTGRGAAMPDVHFNLINQTGDKVKAEQKGPGRMDGSRLILDVVLSEMSSPGKFRDGMKAAMRR